MADDGAAPPTIDARARADGPDVGSDGGGDIAAPDGGATWTQIYSDLLVNHSYPSNCAGAACHDPGKEKGIDLASPQLGYASLLPRVVPGAADASELITVLQAGVMPQGRTRMPIADIDRIRAWIQAGAAND